MMGGLIAATILTLTFLPALYALVFRVPAIMANDSVSAFPFESRGDGFATQMLTAGQ
jgi:hypothetical protein